MGTAELQSGGGQCVAVRKKAGAFRHRLLARFAPPLPPRRFCALPQGDVERLRSGTDDRLATLAGDLVRMEDAHRTAMASLQNRVLQECGAVTAHDQDWRAALERDFAELRTSVQGHIETQDHRLRAMGEGLAELSKASPQMVLGEAQRMTQGLTQKLADVERDVKEACRVSKESAVTLQRQQEAIERVDEQLNALGLQSQVLLVWCGVVWCGVVWCGVVWCGVVWCGVVWCGVVWCGVVWYGVVWCGVAWCGVVSFAVVRMSCSVCTPCVMCHC